ncbi:MAG: transglutaminase-like domain-containing protein [Anaerolineales bacterium]
MNTTKISTPDIVKNTTIQGIYKPNYTRYLITAASLVAILALLSITALGAYTLLPAKIHYRITKTFHIYQTTGDAEINLGLMLPKSGPYQSVHNLSIQWDGDQEIKSRAYVDLLELSGQVNADGEKTALVDYEVTLAQGNPSWQAPVAKFDMLPQEGIESNHEEIKTAASSVLSGASGNPAARIFQFVSSYLDYSENGCEETNVSALEAFRTRVGACIGYSRLMVALCRASGIPAKMIIGTILPDILFSLPHDEASSVPGSGHAWVEYNLQDSWHFADPSWGYTNIGFPTFNHNDGRHLSLGDFDQFTASKAELFNWATEDASPKNVQLTSIFASNSGQTEIATETSIRKTWDQRWLNVILALAAVAFILSKVRDRVISKYYPD